MVVNGQDLGLGGYLDVGLVDTMEDLLVNFVGALSFSVIGLPLPEEQGRRNVRTSLRAGAGRAGEGGWTDDAGGPAGVAGCGDALDDEADDAGAA